ncbi:MAG: DUF3072 domain-containing protein [Pyrinomonadaceae bacterium]
MADQQNNGQDAIKDPKEWKSGDDPATPSQLSYVETLATQAGEEPPEEDLTKAQASVQIDRLREEAGVED